uniref:Protein RIC1 n=1 Tax=Anthurium amnicola TaxID=1678845 RepID=A0A1D1YHG6_9ARAE
MYMAYGWPQAIPLLEPQGGGSLPSSLSSARVVYIKVANHFLLVVAPGHLELWSSSQHRIRLGMHMRDAESISREGENLQAAWSPDAKTVAVLTSSLFLHMYKVRFSGKKLLVGGKQLGGLSPATISLVHSEKTPLSDKNWVTSNFVCDSKSIIFGLANGLLNLVSWKGEFSESFEIGCYPHAVADEVPELPESLGFATSLSEQSLAGNGGGHYDSKTAVIQLDLSLPLRLLIVLYSDGRIALCSISKKGVKKTDSIKAERWMTVGDAVYASVASEQQVLAVGCKRGVVELYDLAESSSLLRTVSLYDWGYSMEDTGPVSCIAWTPDNSAFAVGWKYRGLTVWSVSGCRLMSTIRQIGMSSISSPMVKPNQDLKHEPLMDGTSFVQWDGYGYKLYAVEEGSSERILAFSFGKCCISRGLSGTTYVRQVIYGEDRVLVVQSDESDDLKILHLNLPVSYISQNWPILHVVASKDGMYLAIAGLRGLILYDLRYKKWRVFGDITQEQQIECKGLLWLGKIVVICNFVQSSNVYELLFFPRYHLDQSSLLFRKPLVGKPVVMDAFDDYLLVTYRPFDVHIFHVKISGEISPSNTPVLQLSTVRELSIMTAKSHPAAMSFIPDITPREGIQRKKNFQSALVSLVRQPSRCLILRSNGELSLLDLDDGHERGLTDSVELFWVTSGQSEEKTNLIEEVSWLDYGCRGMQVWYPSPGADPFKQEDFLQLDPELEFDREVYPLGLLPNAGVVVGVSQRTSFSSCTEFPCFEPLPQAQTILHCLLRHLLQRDKIEEALRLACLSAEKPHFSHCLEWLLFTVFDAEISRQSANKNQLSASVKSSTHTLLEKTCNLIRNFPEYLDVVVSVARKTDGRHWADLFSSAGRSTELFEECFQRRWYRTAACYILVIAKLEGPAVSQYCALRLLQATLDESLYELAGELVRFLLRSGKEYESATPEYEKLSPRFLGFFLFPSTYRKQPVDIKSPSFNELSAHIASVKNILENHASYLMSEKELSKLVAFVKGTQFDLVEYLQRERMGSARLESFASGLELIGQKLQMSSLQSRLDAEFLLAHMCSVKFKEWIVILATLLRRVEVLFDLFRHDLRLWKAYSSTLQSQSAFEEYHDLLQVLEHRLSSVAEVDKK